MGMFMHICKIKIEINPWNVAEHLPVCKNWFLLVSPAIEQLQYDIIKSSLLHGKFKLNCSLCRAIFAIFHELA